MAKKQLFTKEDKVRLQKESGGNVKKGSLAAKAQSAVDKRNNKKSR